MYTVVDSWPKIRLVDGHPLIPVDPDDPEFPDADANFDPYVVHAINIVHDRAQRWTHEHNRPYPPMDRAELVYLVVEAQHAREGGPDMHAADADVKNVKHTPREQTVKRAVRALY